MRPRFREITGRLPLCHRRLYLTVTAEKDGQRWSGKAAIYKDAGPIAERYRKMLGKLQKKDKPAKKV